MKKKIIFSYILLLVIFCHAQTDIPFGKQFETEINIPITAFVNKISVEKLKSDYYKEYYYSLTTDDSNWYSQRDVLIKTVTGTKYTIVIPPLEPNAFYRIKYEYYGNDNLFAVMKMLHDGSYYSFDEATASDKDWMKAFRMVSNKYDPFLLTYRPTKKDLKEYKELLIDKFDLSGTLTNQAQSDLKIKTLNYFRNLKIGTPPKDDAIIAYAKFVKDLDTTNIDDEELNKLEQIIGSYYDYKGFYDLYNKYFKNYFIGHSFFNSVDYINFFKKKINEEVAQYHDDEAIPNILVSINDQITSGYKTLSTFPTTFATAYSRAIVPDFGYIVYINNKNDFKGGSPFIGVNISLAPVNKDIPMSLSNLTIWQKLSIHTGIAINKLAENKKRADFFKDNSLMLGIGYKIINQSFRINAGGVFYKSLHPISGTSSVAVQPYIGLSIDFEIRKWLNQIVPALKL